MYQNQPDPKVIAAEKAKKEMLAKAAKAKEIQQKTQALITELGEIELIKIQIEQRHTIARDFLEDLSNREKEFTKLVFEKYGKSNIDPSTGEIINLD
jgi:hypothetical protein